MAQEIEKEYRLSFSDRECLPKGQRPTEINRVFYTAKEKCVDLQDNHSRFIYLWRSLQRGGNSSNCQLDSSSLVTETEGVSSHRARYENKVLV